MGLRPWAVPCRRRQMHQGPIPALLEMAQKPVVMKGWMRWVPGLQMLREYQAAWLVRDLMAGLVLTAMLVPVGIAYAQASGVPGIYGLYATIVPMLAYALFGPSRIMVLGPDSSLAAVILAVVLPLSGGDPARAVALASMMAVVTGLALHPHRDGAAGVHHRAALEADPLRLHERDRAHGARSASCRSCSGSRSRAPGRCANLLQIGAGRSRAGRRTGLRLRSAPARWWRSFS